MTTSLHYCLKFKKYSHMVADKTKYMVMTRDQNAGRIHSVKIDNNIFERVE